MKRFRVSTVMKFFWDYEVEAESMDDIRNGTLPLDQFHEPLKMDGGKTVWHLKESDGPYVEIDDWSEVEPENVQGTLAI